MTERGVVRANALAMIIPASPRFSDLELELDDAGGLRYRPAPLAAHAGANGLDVDVTDEDEACALVCAWYVAHREAGGKPDATAETIVALLNARGAVRSR